MKVSIITATFNSKNHIYDTYRTIKEQTFIDWEWVVTDDASSDSTLKLLNEIAASDSRVKIYSLESNSGAAVARNNSIAKAQGEYLAFIDSDDMWLSDKLYIQLKFMEKSTIDFSFTAYEIVDYSGDSLCKKVDTHLIGSITYDDMLKKKATLGCSTVMLKREGFNDVLMPLLRTGQDYATWLKLLKTGKNAYPITDVLTQYRILPNSISRNKVKKAKRQWQIYREVEELSFIKSAFCFCFYAWRAVFRK